MFAGRVVAATSVLLIAAAPAATAQTGSGISGPWLGFGVGGGASTSSEFRGSEHFGGAFYLRAGGGLSEQVLFGGEFVVWGRRHANDLSPARGNLGLTVLYRPAPSAPVFLQAGAGVAVGALLRPHMSGVTTRNANGFGATGGVGALVRLGRSVYLTPGITFLYQYFPSGADPALSNGIILINLGLTFG